MGTAPPRCLRGRWGSTDKVESHFIAALPYLPKVISSAFTKSSRKHATGSGPGADEDAAYFEEQSKYKDNVIKLMAAPLFLAMIVISQRCKAILIHALHWGQAAIKECNAAMRHCRSEGFTYLGATPLSVFYTQKASKWFKEFSDQLDPSTIDKDEEWGLVWNLLPAASDDHAMARALIVTLVLGAAAQWTFRFLDVANSWPMRLLLLLEKAPAISCDIRKQVAADLNAAQHCCLDRSSSDVALKLKAMFRAEFVIVETQGTSPLTYSQFC